MVACIYRNLLFQPDRGSTPSGDDSISIIVQPFHSLSCSKSTMHYGKATSMTIRSFQHCEFDG